MQPNQALPPRETWTEQKSLLGILHFTTGNTMRYPDTRPHTTADSLTQHTCRKTSTPLGGGRLAGGVSRPRPFAAAFSLPLLAVSEQGCRCPSPARPESLYQYKMKVSDDNCRAPALLTTAALWPAGRSKPCMQAPSRRTCVGRTIFVKLPIRAPAQVMQGPVIVVGDPKDHPTHADRATCRSDRRHRPSRALPGRLCLIVPWPGLAGAMA